MTTQAAPAEALVKAVLPTARTIRWVPPAALAALLLGLGALAASSPRPAGSFLTGAAAALASGVVGSLHDPARILLEPMPVSRMWLRLVRVALVGAPALVLWLWLGDLVYDAPGPGIGPLVALTAAGTAAVVWSPGRRSVAVGAMLPVAWFALGAVAPATGLLAELADLWWSDPWWVAGVAAAACVLGRSR